MANAERAGKHCPLCDQLFAQDLAGRGWVRHLTPPDIVRTRGRIDQDSNASQDLKVRAKEYLKRTEHCPFGSRLWPSD